MSPPPSAGEPVLPTEGPAGEAKQAVRTAQHVRPRDLLKILGPGIISGGCG